MKKNKEIIAFLLFLVFVFSLCIIPASAGYEVQYGDAARALWEEGLFLGSGDSFDLDKPITRAAADLLSTSESTKPSADSLGSDGWLKANIEIKTVSTTAKPDSWPRDAKNISLFIGDGYASTLSWAVGPEGEVRSPEATLHATSGTAKLYSYWVVSEPAAVELAIICDGKTIYALKDFTVNTGDYVDIDLAVDMAALGTVLGAGVHKVSIAVIKPVYLDGKFLYEDNKEIIGYNLGTGEKGATFKLSKGLSGSAITDTYLYAGSQTYGVKYFFTLETGKYGGDYTMSFPTEDGTDNRTFTVEQNSIYHITYTYGIDYSTSRSYEYKFSVNLTGPQSATLSFNSKHPGKMNIGNFNIDKQ